MVTDRELERLLEGRWKALTPTQQHRMALEIKAYRKAAREFQKVERTADLDELTALGQEMGDYDLVQGSIEAFVEMRK